MYDEPKYHIWLGRGLRLLGIVSAFLLILALFKSNWDAVVYLTPVLLLVSWLDFRNWIRIQQCDENSVQE